MSPISASQIAQFKATLVSFYKSTWTHPRHNARVWLLSALSVGGVLNFLSTIAALMERYENAPIVVAVWAGVVVSLYISLPFSFSFSFSFPFLFYLKKKGVEGGAHFLICETSF